MSPQYMEKLGPVEVAPGVYGTWSSYESLQITRRNQFETPCRCYR